MQYGNKGDAHAHFVLSSLREHSKRLLQVWEKVAQLHPFLAMSLLWLTVFSLLQSSVGLPLSNFGSEAGDAELGPNDDGSSPAISLPSPFPFFDSLQETVYVS